MIAREQLRACSRPGSGQLDAEKAAATVAWK
jgi:hypothetical protein